MLLLFFFQTIRTRQTCHFPSLWLAQTAFPFLVGDRLGALHPTDFVHPQGEVGAALGDQSAIWGWKQQASKAMGQSHGGVTIAPSGCRAEA